MSISEIRVSLLFLFCTLLTSVVAMAEDFPKPANGAVEFVATPVEKPHFGRDMVLLRSVSSDGEEAYEIHVVAEDLLVVRDFGKCFQSTTRFAHHFKKDQPHKIKLAWHGATTKLSIDGEERDPFELSVVDKFGKPAPIMKLSDSGEYQLSGLRVESVSGIDINPADVSFVANNVCRSLDELYAKPIQETYQSIAFRNFPDDKTRARVKSYIDILPAKVAASFNQIIYIDRKHSGQPWQGLSETGIGIMLLQWNAIEEPSTFFHESAHFYDFTGYKETGKLRSSRWRKVTGEDEESPLIRANSDASSLSYLDASTSFEQMAAYTGDAYAWYFKPANHLDTSDAVKMQFLLDEGFLTQRVHDKITGGH